jgi:hypothetical protein
MASQIHEGDIGTKLLITVTDDGQVVDISSASSLSIFIKKPNGTILTRVGTLETDGTDGKMYYITVSGDLDVAGNYKIQGQVVLPTGSYYTSTATFKVHCNL